MIKQTLIITLTLTTILTVGCVQMSVDHSVDGQASENTGLMSEESVSQGIILEEAEKEEQPETTDAEERNPNYWYTEPNLQDTFMLRVEGNISANQAWVDFLKGEMPDYTGIDFSDVLFNDLNKPYNLTDIERFFLDDYLYGDYDWQEYAGRLISMQIFPYDVDNDKTDELLFVCDSYAGLVKMWMLDDEYQDVLCLLPSTHVWSKENIPNRIWLWSNGIKCSRYFENENTEYCPNEITFSYNKIFEYGSVGTVSVSVPIFQMQLAEVNQKEVIYDVFVFSPDFNGLVSATQDDPAEKIGTIAFSRNGEVVDGTLIYAENVSTGPEYDEDLETIIQSYEEIVGDAVPVRELTGLKDTEDGVITVTREEFYSGEYLE